MRISIIQSYMRILSLLCGIYVSLSAQYPLHSIHPITSTTPTKKKDTVWITVFVHGIMSIKPHLSFNNFVRLKSDKLEHSTYARAVELMRKDPHFYQNQAMQGIGIKKIYPYAIRKGDASSALAYLYETMDPDTQRNNEDHVYYTFGWSGLLSSKARYTDAGRLYTDLERIMQKYRAQYKQVKLRLVGYSHGGNVLLNLANVHRHQHPNPSFCVDELITMGMPILRETDHLICDTIFKKIYHFYSRSDNIVRLDFFSSHNFLSDRNFIGRRGFQLPSKLMQFEIKVTRPTSRALFNRHLFEKTQDYSRTDVITGRNKLLRDISPGHIELWFFGWTPHHYRDSFPLFPLPVIAYTPFIIYQTNKHKTDLCVKNPIIVDIRPEHNVMLFKQHDRCRRLRAIVPLFPDTQLSEIKNSILKIAPDNYEDERYNEHLYYAVRQAKEEYHERVKNQRRCRRGRRKKSPHAARISSHSCNNPCIPNS